MAVSVSGSGGDAHLSSRSLDGGKRGEQLRLDLAVFGADSARRCRTVSRLPQSETNFISLFTY